MKTTKRTFGKFLALALVFLFALTAVVPVFAEPAKEGPGNMKVTIHNNEGLPPMKVDQFNVYQIFKGTAHEDGKADPNEWDAFSWNNYTLADIEWGASLGEEAVAELKKTLAAADWAKVGETNVFATWATAEAPKGTAAELAEILVGKDNAFLQNFAKAVVGNTKIKTVTLPKPETETEPGAESKTNPELVPGDTDSAADDSLVFTFKEAGYYLFAEKREEHIGDEHKDDAVAEYMLAVVGEQNILLKASVPKVDKEIVGGANGKKGDVAGVGDYVQFKLTGTLPKNYGDFDTYKYIFHDTLSAGLTYVNDDTHPLTVRVYEDQTAANADTNVTDTTVVVPMTYGDPAANNYTVGVGEESPIPCSLEVSFADLKALKKNGEPDPSTISVTADSVIVVTYWAKVNENAVILDDGNPNTVLLEYSNDPNNDGTGKTKEKTVYVYAFGLDLTKVGDDDAHAGGLGDAGFVLKKGAGPDTTYAIFEDQWVLTSADGNTQSFYNSKEKAEEANTDSTGKVSGPVKRLTGWTSESSDPNTAEVERLIAAYKAGTQKTGLEDCLLMSGTDGAIPDIYGLDEGSYALEEVIVPDGYNTPEKDFDISIDATINEDTGKLEKVVYTHGGETVTYLPKESDYNTGNLGAGESVPETSEAADRVVRFGSGLLKDDIVNQKAPFLPFTGGIGTMIFYVLGTLLIAGAITYLVIATKKRKSAE